jgi:hypothetical protein
VSGARSSAVLIRSSAIGPPRRTAVFGLFAG